MAPGTDQAGPDWGKAITASLELVAENRKLRGAIEVSKEKVIIALLTSDPRDYIDVAPDGIRWRPQAIRDTVSTIIDKEEEWTQKQRADSSPTSTE